MSYLGIDVGTSGCKAVVFDENGRQLAEAHREYPTHMPEPGRAELDSQEVMRACREVLKAAAGQCLANDPVEGLGISSQGEAFTTLGRDGRCLTRAMVSSDARANDLAATWSEEFGRERLYRKTGHTAHPMFSLFKMLWVRDNLPDVWANAGSFFCFEEMLHRELGVEPAISHPLAGRTMLFNVTTHRWDEDILEAVGLDAAKLARTLPAGAIVGRVPPPVAEQLNLAPGAVVVAGGHDQPCGALGAGVLESGRAMYGMGTVECICPAFEEAVFSTSLFESNLCTYDFTAEPMYTTVAFSLTGGNLLRWFKQEFASDLSYRQIDAGLPATPTDLLVLPYFTPTGTPYFDADARSAVLGMTLNTTRNDLARALLEGVTYEMKLNVHILEQSGVVINDFIATGGGAKSRVLTQLKADVLNRAITVVAVTEAGCLGVAMLARQALTNEPLRDIAGRWVRAVSVVEPDAGRAQMYSDKFGVYRELYPAVSALAL